MNSSLDSPRDTPSPGRFALLVLAVASSVFSWPAARAEEPSPRPGIMISISEEMTSLWLSRQVGRARGPMELPMESLTDRELSVLRLIGQGYSTNQIAEELTLSVKTIESHRDNVRQKLGLESSGELIRYATIWLERAAGGD